MSADPRVALVVVVYCQPEGRVNRTGKMKSATQNYIFFTLHGFALCLVHSNESKYRFSPIEISSK